jgi:hypothetical protein
MNPDPPTPKFQTQNPKHQTPNSQTLVQVGEDKISLAPSALAPFGDAKLSLLDEVCVLPRPFCIVMSTTIHFKCVLTTLQWEN